MSRTRTALVLALAALLVAAVVSSCKVADPPALTVGSWSLSRKDFLDQMKALTDKGVIPPASGNTQSTGSPTAYDTASTAKVLNVYAQQQLLTQELERRGITVTPDDEVAYLQQRADQASQQSGQQVTVQQLRQQVDKLDDYQKRQYDTALKGQALIRSTLPDAELEKVARENYDKNKASLESTCLSAILVADQSAAQQVPGAPTTTAAPGAANEARAKIDAAKAKLDGGTPFADVAKTDSEDQRSGPQGGDVGCYTAAEIEQLPPELLPVVKALPVGGISAVVPVQGAFAIVTVRSKGIPSFDDAKAQLITQARQSLGKDRLAAVQEQLRKQAVTVDPLFGVWNAEAGQVTEPSGAATPSTTTPLVPGPVGIPGLDSPTPTATGSGSATSGAAARGASGAATSGASGAAAR